MLPASNMEPTSWARPWAPRSSRLVPQGVPNGIAALEYCRGGSLMCSRHISTWPEGHPMHMPERTHTGVALPPDSGDNHRTPVQPRLSPSHNTEGSPEVWVPTGSPRTCFICHVPPIFGEARLMLTGFPAPQGSVRKPHRDTSDFLACLPR